MNQTVEQKSFHFAVQIVKLCKNLRNGQKEFVLSNQLLRSGTSIGANVAEAQQAQSRADFVSKINIALKEAVETDYWLRLLNASDYLPQDQFHFYIIECREIQKMLTAIVKTSKKSEDD
ncbi:MAG: four helix bundle protein [Candidatus Faecousia sp.]|nr:four helix bundle protein [Clostridiales bacterium]MDY6179539.1 four helix bundle protein [Candidatus Faecousia sp.]